MLLLSSDLKSGQEAVDKGSGVLRAPDNSPREQIKELQITRKI